MPMFYVKYVYSLFPSRSVVEIINFGILNIHELQLIREIRELCTPKKKTQLYSRGRIVSAVKVDHS